MFAISILPSIKPIDGMTDVAHQRGDDPSDGSPTIIPIRYVEEVATHVNSLNSLSLGRLLWRLSKRGFVVNTGDWTATCSCICPAA
jgi:hypothetical protein